MNRVYVPAADTWRYFQQKATDLEGYLGVVAESDEAEICMTAESGSPVFVVFCHDESIHKVPVADEAECVDLAVSYYDRYILDGEGDECAERYAEIYEAFCEFAGVLTGGEDVEGEYGESLITEALSGVLELMVDYGFSIAHPYSMADEYGCDT
jgi:hypothetical protein